MKGSEKIIEHIRADARAQADAVLAKAEEQCAAIRADYEAKARDSYAQRLRAGVKVCEDRVDSMDRIARMEARKGVLALKQEMVSESFALAQRKLTELPEAEYVALLARLAAGAAVTGDEELLLNARDRAAVGDKVVKAANALLTGQGRAAALTLAEGEGDFAGGFILRRGSIEVNCTAELLVELQRGEMAAELANVLFA
ncbi:MAG: hypothetical protein IJJ43_00085 [Oscillospiraceae bacterium]|nr:hypothetical protein [Oscillospiraceae bacterium]